MDAATITKLVAESVKAEMAKAKAEDEGASARAQNPIETLKVWLESLQGEERMSALQQVQAMLSSMGAMVEAGAGAGLAGDKLAAFTAELKAVAEEKDAKALRARLGKALESISGPVEKTDAEKELDKMRAEMRDMAIAHELDKLAPELKLEGPAVKAAMRLSDLSGVTVSGNEVAGLRESLQATIKDHPFLVGTAKAEANAGGDGSGQSGAGGTPATTGRPEGDPLAAAKAELEKAKAEAEKQAELAAKKAEELQALSAASIRESISAEGVKAIPEDMSARIRSLQMRARQGDHVAAVEYGRIRKKLLAGA